MNGKVSRRTLLRISLSSIGTTILSACRGSAATTPTAIGRAIIRRPQEQGTATATAQGQRAYWPTKEWRVALPQEHGIDISLLARMDSYITKRLPNVYSLLIVRHGYLVFERYYQGHDRGSIFAVHSVTKSVISALIGITLHDYPHASLDQTIADLFPEYFPQTDPRKQTITLRHLLTMTSGFAWQGMSDYIDGIRSPDWIRFLIDRPLSSDPGTQFNYNTLGAHLLSAALTRLTKLPAVEFARQHLLTPLGITSYRWWSDPQGNSNGGDGLSLTARDMAKFGYLYLNQGQWDGEAIIPVAWVQESTSKHSEGPGNDWKEFKNIAANYGYLWWVSTEKGIAACFALGYGQQYIYVLPALDIVIVSTADDTASEILSTRLLPSVFIVPSVNDKR